MCLSSSNQQQQISLDSSFIILEPTAFLSYTVKKLAQFTSSNSGGETIIVEEASIVDDITEWSSKKSARYISSSADVDELGEH